MTVSLYADAIAELRTLFAELDRNPDLFQTFDVRLELAASGSLVVYETKRRKGQTDSLYYGRPGADDANRQISQAAAFAAIDRFFALGQFIALTGEGGQALDTQYPHCAVNFSYRKKGHPAARSMLMVFVGFNDEADAAAYVAKSENPAAFISRRPYTSAKAYEWK
ncbi:hypothetical protein GB928_020020 [Shinella curvata]|uniref:Uncharacterized protein n=1 Tax=Shinella curvata TaxID=1817964 RepID=A0ABT8XJX8_9HYPH|nr:hypothetical protein [Shinella curvata]MCJ8055914.1 hypothetical protein [Shinella curvata]MDO6123485.1 hypothetical protein [Shinella curvata]